MKKKVLISVLMSLIFTGYLYAQEGVLKGNITDAANGDVLIGASILIKGTTIGTITDLDGNYIIENLPTGSQMIVASFVGYSKKELSVDIKSEGETVLDLQLAPDLIGLDQVVITGVVNQKAAIESSVAMTTLKPKSVEQFGATTTAELFKAIPGIRSESSGGEGNANIAVRGIPVASGGSKFLQLHEDGLPVMQFGDISFGNADIFVRSDRTIGRIEAIKGGSASTFASNSPAGIINFISKTGATEGGSVGMTLGADYKSFRTDFEYGSPIADGFRFHVGGFFRQGQGPRNPGYNANNGGQIKANITKDFEKGYARLYFKYLDDKTISYMPMPVKVTGTSDNPTYESVPGFDLTNSSLQSPYFNHMLSVDGQGNSRVSDMSEGMHPKSIAVGGEFSFDLGSGWNLKERFRYAKNHGKFVSPFPAQVAGADDIATSIAGSGYSLSYANGANAGVALSESEINNLNDNGLLMRIHTFDVDINNLDNFTNDIYLTRSFDKWNVTAGYYKAMQNIGMTWLWQSYLTDVSSDNGPRLMNLEGADGTQYTSTGLLAHGVPYWGNCCTRGYDMNYIIDAVYANVGVELTDDLNMEASMRYDMGDVSGYYLNNYQAPVDVDNNGDISYVEQEVTVLDNANPNVVNYDYSYLSYSIGANYQINNDQAVYTRYSKGGRANADRLLYTPFIDDEGKTIDGLDADEIGQLELGYKYKSPSLAVIVTGFLTNIKEQNEEFGRILNKEFRTYGAEFEGIYSLKEFNLAVGATYTKAEITKSLNEDEEGNEPRRVPSLLYNVSPSYDLFNKRSSIGFSVVGTTKVYAQDDNAIVLPGYAYVNAFLSYNIIKGLNARANVNNLFNTLGFTEMEGDTFVENSTNYLRARPITGRATTVSLTYTF
ncbi:TonB-dependent receptor domain-containing protein [Carboxylicivirga caseinilyticus]|uniref:TonB-dependent receptor domain-containing protein n=1 Tax=Carboxylicivirga caseinilyticus TaxID=3417572 RepID=UPI003D32D696|nr:TonB-dependent receptor [Marinilabiliaceae bacterium A049]